MKDVNKVILIGRLGADPVLKESQAGKSRALFSVATSRMVKADNESGWDRTVDWHRVVAWGKLADISSKYLGKGSAVYIEGTLVTRRWETPEGQSKILYEVHAHELNFLSNHGKVTPEGGASAELDSADTSELSA